MDQTPESRSLSMLVMEHVMAEGWKTRPLASGSRPALCCRMSVDRKIAPFHERIIAKPPNTAACMPSLRKSAGGTMG